MITSEDVRGFALSLPEAEELETWGHPTFRVRNKMFMGMGNNGQAVSVKASLEEQDALIQSDPETFSVPQYVGRFGWVSVQLSSVDTRLMRELIIEAWRRTALKRSVAAYDAQSDGC